MNRFFSKYYKVIAHVLIWSVFIVLHVNFFSSVIGTTLALKRGVLILTVYLLIFYLNWFIFVPEFYIRKKYSAFFLFAVIILIFASLSRYGIEIHYNMPIELSNNQPFISNFALRKFMFSIVPSIFVFIAGFLFKISDYYAIQTKQKNILLQQKTEAELKLLKAQLNPHFLFNALNNIYALVLTRSENAANSLMSLSQLLRYIVYDAVAEKVALDKEITYLKYYIDLEKLRFVKNKNFKIDIFVGSNNYKILPLIFIPFVENSFKHSNINKGGKINIKIQLIKNELQFICENTYSAYKKSVDQTGGIGLLNSKKRLEMLYPDKHKLSVTDENNIFLIKLNILL